MRQPPFTGTVSVPTFVQQRAKLRPEAMERLFREFKFRPRKLYYGFRLLAMDGSDMQILTAPSDYDSYFPGTRGQKPFNVTKIGALSDLNDRSYADAIVKGKGIASGLDLPDADELDMQVDPHLARKKN